MNWETDLLLFTEPITMIRYFLWASFALLATYSLILVTLIIKKVNGVYVISSNVVYCEYLGLWFRKTRLNPKDVLL